MKDITRMNQTEEDITSGLQSLGIKRAPALALAGLHSLGTTRAIDLEQRVGLRQPEVSIGVTSLIKRGWVSETYEKKTSGKGRPNKVYTLKVPFTAIVADLEAEINEKANKKEATLNKLRVLAKNK
ncbi:MAG: transcriptional regulator [Candidatus Ratteibacteria bacterium]|nr:transcriptional regulator [Candidatus Ratteibacteria bacterium]